MALWDLFFFPPKLFGSTSGQHESMDPYESMSSMEVANAMPMLCQCYANAILFTQISSLGFPPVRPLMFIAHGPMVFMVFIQYRCFDPSPK